MRRIELKLVNGVNVLTLVDETVRDELHIQELGDELNKCMQDSKDHNVVVSFSNVRFLSSSTLEKFIKLGKLAKQLNRGLKFSTMRSDVYEVFKITHLESVFDIRETDEDAIDALK